MQPLSLGHTGHTQNLQTYARLAQLKDAHETRGIEDMLDNFIASKPRLAKNSNFLEVGDSVSVRVRPSCCIDPCLKAETPPTKITEIAGLQLF